MTLAEWVKAERKKRKWTQAQLAAETGVLKREEVVAIEGGDNQGTSARVQKALAKAFGVDLADVGVPETERVAPKPSKLPGAAIGRHPDFDRVWSEMEARYPRVIDPQLKRLVAEAAGSFGTPRHLTVELLKAVHDAVAAGEAAKLAEGAKR